MRTIRGSTSTLCIGTLLLLGTLAGCGLIPAKKVWDTAQANIVGMSEEKILACMGEPAKRRESGVTKTLSYGYRVTFDDSAAWCIVNVQTTAGKVSRMTQRSGFPGSIAKSDWVCGHVVEPCFGDDTLQDSLNALPGFIGASRMQDLEAEALQTQSLGVAADNASMSRALALSSAINAAGSTSNRASVSSSLSPAPPPPNPTSNNTLGPAPRRQVQPPVQSSGTSQSPSQSPSAQTISQPDRLPAVNPSSTTPTPDVQARVTLTDQVISNGTFNLWRVKINNNSSFAVRCFISASYRFSDPNGSGKLVSDSSTRTVDVSARSAGNADFGFTDRNIQTDSYRLMNCRRL